MLITRTEWVDIKKLQEGCQKMEAAGWAVRQIVLVNATASQYGHRTEGNAFVVFEREKQCETQDQ